jgi:hypothetical protein
MIEIFDMAVDESDDIIFTNTGIQIEASPYISTMNAAQRRVCARLDDYPNYSSAAAGLEQFLFQIGVKKYSQDIKYAVNRALTRDNLLSQANLQIDIIDTKTDTAKLLVHFIFPLGAQGKRFRVFVDTQNQRIFRGNN